MIYYENIVKVYRRNTFQLKFILSLIKKYFLTLFNSKPGHK